MSAKNKIGKSDAEGFLSRWARVKESSQNAPAQQGLPTVATGANDEVQKENTSRDAVLQQKVAEDALQQPGLPAQQQSIELPSLESMTPQSDYSPFMARDVDPKLRNLAMKKLFTDPHYNVMDRLDIYIDDYSTHAPLPIDVIRQMSISKTLGLFDDEEKEGKDAVTVDSSSPQGVPAEAVTLKQQDAVMPPQPLPESPSVGDISTGESLLEAHPQELRANK